jgi:DNA primase large subunit
VPDLVEKRKVFMKKGWAYVHTSALSSVVFQEFEVQLGKALEVGTRIDFLATVLILSS